MEYGRTGKSGPNSSATLTGFAMPVSNRSFALFAPTLWKRRISSSPKHGEWRSEQEHDWVWNRVRSPHLKVMVVCEGLKTQRRMPGEAQPTPVALRMRRLYRYAYRRQCTVAETVRTCSRSCAVRTTTPTADEPAGAAGFRPAYRAHLDRYSARSRSISSVRRFHAGLGHVSGGFVGVDVFFVLSGYLVTRAPAR